MERSEANRLLRTGRQMSPDEAGAAEARVEAAPQLIDERLTLVGFYWIQSCGSDRYADKLCSHVIDLIRHDPLAEFLRDPLFFVIPAGCSHDTRARIRDEWLKQMDLHPTSVQVLDNAASFFKEFDPLVADRLFRRACELDGDEGRWAFRRALLLSSQIRGGLADRFLIETKIKDLELSRFKQADEHENAYLLAELAACAFAVGMDRDATRLAHMSVNAAQPSHGSDGFDDPLHASNILLGRTAIRSGDRAQAARYLLDAAKICRSAHPEPLGPDVVLAGELLAAGERGAVEEYLTTCASLWVEGRAILAGWADEIKRGQTPDLLANYNLFNGRLRLLESIRT